MLRKLKVLLFIPLLFVATACCDRGAEMAKYTIHFDLRKAVKMNLPEFVDSIFVIPLATNDSSLIKNVVGLSFVDSIFILMITKRIYYPLIVKVIFVFYWKIAR